MRKIKAPKSPEKNEASEMTDALGEEIIWKNVEMKKIENR